VVKSSLVLMALSSELCWYV